MQQDINRITSVHINEIKSQLNINKNSSSQSISKTFSFFDSIYHNNLFFLTYNNDLIFKSKLIPSSNSTFPFQFKKESPISNSLSSSTNQISSITFTKQTLYLKTSNNEIFIYNIPNLSYESFSFNMTRQLKINGIFQKKQIKQISCGLNHSLFLSYGGMIYSTGDNSFGQLGVDTQDIQSAEQNLITSLIDYNIENILSGNNFNLVYGKKRLNEYNNINGDTKGNVILSWGENSKCQCGCNKKSSIINKPQVILNCEEEIKRVSVGENHSVILLDNGDVLLFGDNTYKQCGVVEDIIREKKENRIGFKCFNDNNEIVINVKTSGNSSLLLGDKGTLMILGKINNNNNPQLMKLEQFDSIEDIIFTDELCLFVHHSNQPFTLINLPNCSIEEVTYSPSSEQPVIPTLCQTQEPNTISSGEISFDDLLLDENTISMNSTNPSDTSLYELRSYINLLGISLSSSYDNNLMSFRPSNLPPKSKAEEEAHRQLVQENRARYRELVRQKQEQEKANLRAQEIRQENEEKRATYWLKEIIPNWTIMKSNKNFEHYFYEGVPPTIRGQVWLLSVGNKFSITRDYYNIEVKKSIQLLMKQKTKERESSLVKDPQDGYRKYIVKTCSKEKSIHLIELDIERTFSYLGVFKNNSPLSNDLREILRAFVVSRPDIGYVQGLSYIAGTLLLQMDKFQSFVCLMNITLNPNILPFYRLEEKGIRQRLEIFNDIFSCNLPKLFEHFSLLEVYPEHYMIDWMMTLFTRNLHIDLAVRIWDVYMIEGIKSLYKAAIVILVYFEKKFILMDFDDILTNLKNIQDLKMDQDTFIDSMRNVKFTDKILHKIQKLNEDYIPIN